VHWLELVEAAVADGDTDGRTTMAPYGFLRAAAESAIRYSAEIGSAPQRPLRDARGMLETFRAPLPTDGSSPEAVIDELVHLAEPGLNAMTGPRFFGWVIGGSHPVGVAADWLTSAWGQNAGNHQASPAAAAAEAVASTWLLELLDLPPECSVGFVTRATVANMVCLAAARGEVLRRVGWDVESQGLFGAAPITVLIGDDAHTTVFSALQMLGLGHDRVVRVDTDDQGRMDAADYARKVQAATAPLIAVLQAGQINTGVFDPCEVVVPAARAAGAWIHVDGAFGLWARACPTRRHLAQGIKCADSWATDGHKWLQTPYDCGYAIVRDAPAHKRAMTVTASYLPVAIVDERDPSHLVPELSRRARGFATWAMIKHLGANGIARLVEQNCRAARALADRVAEDPGVRILNDVQLNQVLLRFGPNADPQAADGMTAATIRRVQAEGTCFAGGVVWRGRQVMRVSVSSWATDEAQVLLAADAILRAWHAVKLEEAASHDEQASR
jgi:glutamate/tyrosine decarboxylase-like PLP-dependent enzyme